MEAAAATARAPISLSSVEPKVSFRVS
jgi:hypothetical protein